MRLDGRRESTNVDDRRGRSVGKIGGVGLGGAIVITHHDNLRFNSLESGDIEEGLAVASKIGDDFSIDYNQL